MADCSDRDALASGRDRGPHRGLRRHRPDDLPAVVRWYRDPELARLTRYQTRR